VDRCALFIDAGYALADGAMAVHGTRRRDSVSWDHAGLLKLLAGLARDRTGLPVLRCYWYETAVEGRRTAEHDALAEMPGLKLRLVNTRPGRREGIESQLRRDLVTLAKSGAISDAFIASADEHLAEIVAEVQDLGLRVVVLHIASDAGWTIPQPLRQECDDIVEISGVHLRSFVELIRGAEPVSPDDQYADDKYAVAGHGVRSQADAGGALANAVSHQGLPAALPAASASYPGQDGGDYRQSGSAYGGVGTGQPGTAGHPIGQPAAQSSGQPAQAPQGTISGATALNGSVLNGSSSASHGQPGHESAAGSPRLHPADPAGVPAYPANSANGGGRQPADSQAGYQNGLAQLSGLQNRSADQAGSYQSGSEYNGSAPNGSASNGAMPNGAVHNPHGAVHNGSPHNGVAHNGAAPGGYQNGAGQNGGGQNGASHNGAPDAYQNLLGPNGLAGGGYQNGHLRNGSAQNGGAAGSYQNGASQNGTGQNGSSHNAALGGYQNGNGAAHAVGSQNGSNGASPVGPGQNGIAQNGGALGGLPGTAMPAAFQAGGLQLGGPQSGGSQSGGPLGVGQHGAGQPHGAGQQPGGQLRDPYGSGMPVPGTSFEAAPTAGQLGQQAYGGNDLQFLPGQATSAGSGGPFGPNSGPPASAAYQSQSPYAQPSQSPYAQPPPAQVPAVRPQAVAIPLPEAVKAAHAEGFSFGESVGRDAPGLWLEAVLARKPRMPSDLEARLLQGSVLPIDSLLHDEVRHSLRRGFWDALESARR